MTAQDERLKSTLAADMSKDLICPITQELMVDPVIAADGNSYERKEITRWLASYDTSPKTNLPLETKALFPNLALKQQIERLVASGELDDQLCAAYKERKGMLKIEHARKLFDEGKVEEAAEIGLPVAQGKMADRCYWGSDGVPRDLYKCVEWAKKAAAGGDRRGQYRLATAYHYGEGGLDEEWPMAVKWYEKAAKQGEPGAMEAVSLARAQKLFDEGKVEKAAELGLPEAQGVMAERCNFGSYGVLKDRAKCVEWAKKAAEGGDRVGQHRLGYAHAHGEGGLAKDFALALKWYEKAAEQGGSAAMTNIGFLYENGGYGVAQNHAAAAGWFRRAAEAGSAAGQSNLGVCYYNGMGVGKDLAAARSWFQSAADQGYTDSIRHLGFMMVNGEGGDRKLDEGVAQWEKAAAKGDTVSQKNLSKLSGSAFRTFFRMS